MVTRGAERREGLSSPLGGWRLEPPPQPRAQSGAGRLISLLALLAAAAIAVAAVFVTRAEQTTPVQRAAVAPTITEAAAAPTLTVPPPAASDRVAPAAGTVVAPPTSQTTQAAAAAEPTAAAQSSVSQAAVEAVVAAEHRAVTLATSVEADQQIRSYLGLSGVAMLPPAFAYTVEPGDTVTKIAARFGLEEATIRFNNFDIYDPDLLEVGATLQLPVRDGVIYVVQSGDALSAVLDNYAADLEATLAFGGNGIANEHQISVGQVLLLVDGSASVAGASYSGGTTTWTMPTFGWPMAVSSISDAFGVPRGNAYGYHTGVDWPAPIGTIVGATAGGVVSYAGWDGGYGYWVEVDHGGGVRSRYAHLNEIFVVVGEWVSAGGFVGSVGNTGASSGAHLHFEIIMNGQPRNPYEWLH